MEKQSDLVEFFSLSLSLSLFQKTGTMLEFAMLRRIREHVSDGEMGTRLFLEEREIVEIKARSDF